MSIIDSTYFNTDVNLTAQQINVVGKWLNYYERELLICLLGYELYKLYEDDLDSSDPQEPQAQRFKDLVDGKDFSFTTRDGYTKSTRWDGLRNETLKRSIIAYKVFYEYTNQNEVFNSNVGQIKSFPENSENANPIYKLVDTWNKMIDIYGSTPKQYTEEYFLNISNYEHYNVNPSAYNFLLANKDTYPEWVFKPIRKENYLSL